MDTKKICLEDSLLQPLDVKEITINCLNDYCLIHIFEYLTIKEKFSIESVSKEWNRLAKLSWSAMKFFDVKDILQILPPIKINEESQEKKSKIKFLINVLRRCSPYLEKLSLYSGSLKNLDYKKFFRKLPKYCNNLTGLRLSEDYYDSKIFTEEFVKLLFTKNPNLNSLFMKHFSIKDDCFMHLIPESMKNLSIKDCNFKTTDYFYDYLSKLKNLNKLKIIGREIDTKTFDSLILSNCENISDLYVSARGKYSHDKFISFLNRQKKLRRLVIKNIELDNDLLSNIPAEHLEELNVEHSSTCTNILNYLNRFQCLQIFTYHIFFLSDEILLDLSKSINENVKEINLYFDYYDFSKKSEVFFERLQNLETFTIKAEEKRDENIDRVLSALSVCKNLKNLFIYVCNFKLAGLKSICCLENLTNFCIHSYFPFSKFKDNHYLKMVKDLPNLRELTLQNCTITENFVTLASKIKCKRGDKHVLKVTHRNDFDDFDVDLNNLPALIKLIYETDYDPGFI